MNPGVERTEKGLENITRIPGEARGQCFYGNLDRCILGGMVGRETRRFLKGGVEADEVRFWGSGFS